MLGREAECIVNKADLMKPCEGVRTDSVVLHVEEFHASCQEVGFLLVRWHVQTIDELAAVAIRGVDILERLYKLH